jgi:tetratricopeptide (TPR) repeat protein
MRRWAVYFFPRGRCPSPSPDEGRRPGHPRKSFFPWVFSAAFVWMTLFSALPANGQSASQEVIRSLAQKLDRWEVEEAWAEVQTLLTQDPRNGQLLELSAQIAFHRGEYPEALKFMKSAIAAGGEDERKRGFALFVEETIGVLGPFKRIASPHFVISLDEKQDGILAEYLIDTLERTYQAMARQYGFEPQEKVRVEVFPDAKAFYYASTLSARDIEVTGAVGLTQFNKLMLLSPRSLVYGYRWLDAISHEYMHYLILKQTANKAPIWFHEGLSKYEETRWREGPSYLSAVYRTLLARALADGRLIPFERMEPSLVKLDSPEDVHLAYAQAASAIEFIIAKSGYEGLRKVMTQMSLTTTRGASDAIRDVLDMSFPLFEREWKDFLSAKGFTEARGAAVRRYKIKEGRATEESLDMEEIKSLVARNRAHLGDLLKERGRVGAAIIEYRRALEENRESVPILSRLAAALIQEGRHPEALAILLRAKELAPDHPTLYSYLGQTYAKMEKFQEARGALENAIAINPFNPETHRGLAAVYEALGDKESARREKEAVSKLTR